MRSAVLEIARREHAHLPAGRGELERDREPRDAAADDDDVGGIGPRPAPGRQLRRRPLGRRILYACHTARITRR